MHELESPDQEQNGAGRPRCVIAIGASAGGIPALLHLLEPLPLDLPAAVLVTVHTPPDGGSALPRVLARAGALPAQFAVNGEPLRPGRVRVAPPDRHLLVKDGSLELSRAPRESGQRPAVDALMRSAARAYGPATIGVILSGALSDGALGLAEVKRCGGTAVVQADAAYSGMPDSALAAVDADHVAPVDELAELLVQLASEIADRGVASSECPPSTADLQSGEALFSRPATGFTCPECGGALWELDVDGAPAYVCHVGHRLGELALVTEHAARVERAIFAAVRALEEQAALQRRLAARLDPELHRRSLARALATAAEAEAQADVLRRTLFETTAAGPAAVEDEEPDRDVPRGGRS